MSLIDGRTAVTGLIGNPVSHSLSPLIHNTLCEMAGINSVYAAFPVETSLEKAVAGAYALGIKGLNVTVPYKRDIMPFLCGMDQASQRICAVNTLKYTKDGYFGYNTDVHGVLKTLVKHRISFENQSLLLLGAGGGACACAFAGAEHGAKRIYIANRTNNNSESLATRIKKYYNTIVETIDYGDIASIKECYFIVQATSVGMNGGISPIKDPEAVKKSGGVFDIIYSPLKTKILRDSEELEKLSVNGIDMLIFQAVRSFEIWHGVKVGKEYVSKLAQTVSEHLSDEMEEE